VVVRCRDIDTWGTNEPQKTDAVEPILTHTCRWTPLCMGYGRLWVIRGQFGVNFSLVSAEIYGLWGVMAY